LVEGSVVYADYCFVTRRCSKYLHKVEDAGVAANSSQRVAGDYRFHIQGIHSHMGRHAAADA